MARPTVSRGIRAAVLAALTFLVLGAVIGAVHASDGSGESFILPTVAIGDRAQYRYVASDPYGSDEPTSGNLTVAWSARDPILLPDGYWHPLEALAITRQADPQVQTVGSDTYSSSMSPFTIEQDYLPGTHELRAFTGGADGSKEPTSEQVLPILVNQTTTYDWRVDTLFFLPEPGEAPDCLFAGAWGGMELSADQALAVPEACFSMMVLGQLPPTLSPRGLETVAGQPAIRYRGDLAQDFGDVSIRVGLDLWMAPTSPYPVRIDVTNSMKGFGEDDSSSETITLVGFTPGTKARGDAPDPWPAEPAAAMRFEPAGFVPVADADSGHPFPLSKAVQAARANATVASFLRAHPEAYVVQADFDEQRTAVDQDLAWSFLLADTQAQMDVSVVRSASPTVAGLPSPLAEALAEVDVFAGEAQPMDWRVIPRADLPALPTVGSLLDRWAWSSGTERDAAQAWGFNLVQEGPLDLESANPPPSGIFLTAGRSLRTAEASVQPNSPGVENSGSMDLDQAIFDEAGGLRGRMTLHIAGSTTYAPNGITAPAAAEGGASIKAAEPGRWTPTPAEAAGVGLFAILVGVLYWLWPQAKAAVGVGLFSRIAGQDLLDHRARAQLLQIVQAEPGIHFQDLVRRSGLPNGTAVHHLGKLTKGGLVSVRALGRYTCYFPGRSPQAAALAAAPVLRSQGARRVYEAIQGRPGLSGLELAGLVALQPSTVNYHVQKLVDSGLVRTARDGRSVRLSPVEAE